MEVFTDQPTPNQLKESEFKVPENAHPTCNGVSLLVNLVSHPFLLFYSTRMSLNSAPLFTLSSDFSRFF